jgi:DNA-binding transcriptional regulator LsrR (DeoR family)
MPDVFSDDRLRIVARLYYLDGLGQSEVTKFAKVSPAKVSRLLSLAKERGIVRITVADYDPRPRCARRTRHPGQLRLRRTRRERASRLTATG